MLQSALLLLDLLEAFPCLLGRVFLYNFNGVAPLSFDGFETVWLLFMRMLTGKGNIFRFISSAVRTELGKRVLRLIETLVDCCRLCIALEEHKRPALFVHAVTIGSLFLYVRRAKGRLLEESFLGFSCFLLVLDVVGLFEGSSRVVLLLLQV